MGINEAYLNCFVLFLFNATVMNADHLILAVSTSMVLPCYASGLFGVFVGKMHFFRKPLVNLKHLTMNPSQTLSLGFFCFTFLK